LSKATPEVQRGLLGLEPAGEAEPYKEYRTLAEWLKEYPELLQRAREAYKNHPEWQGIDPDRTPVKYVPGSVTQKIRQKKGEKGGHHPHALSLGGPLGQKLTWTGEKGGQPKHPMHKWATNLHSEITRAIKKQMLMEQAVQGTQ